MCVMTAVVLINMAMGWFEYSEASVIKPLPRQLSIVVPTYRENENITPLAERVFTGVCHRRSSRSKQRAVASPFAHHSTLPLNRNEDLVLLSAGTPAS